MATFPWSAIPTITTDRLTLREISPDDAEDVFQFRSDLDVQRYNTRPMRSVIEAQVLVSTMHNWYRLGQAIQWGITVRGDDRVVGICGLHDWTPQYQRALVGYDLAREHWGRGYAHEAMREVVRIGFEQLLLTHIEAVTVVENRRSVRLLERLGFSRKGLRRERSPVADGAFRDNAIYGLSRDGYSISADAATHHQGDPPTAAPAP